MAESEYNEKAKQRTIRYLKKLKSIQLRVKPEYYDSVKAAAEKKEMSMRAYVLAAIDEKMKHDAN